MFLGDFCFFIIFSADFPQLPVYGKTGHKIDGIMAFSFFFWRLHCFITVKLSNEKFFLPAEKKIADVVAEDSRNES